MPKVYDQQISWQATNTQKMQYDKLQDFISPAMENAARAANNVQQAIVEMQDKQVAEAADLLAQKQADIINNFDEFSLKDPQGEMVNRSMKEWDKFIAEMPVEARRRFERNNPKAREIFELKSQEAATKRARGYTTAKKKADVNRTAQDIIARGVTPENIQVLLQQEYDDAGKTMTPEDYIEYQQLLGYAVQQGAIDDAISHGNLSRAMALNDRKDFTVNLSPKEIAKNRISINRLMDKDEDGDGSGSGSGSGSAKGGSLYNSLVMTTYDSDGAARRSIDVYHKISSGMPKQVINAMGIDDNTIIAGGKTLAQIYNMYPEQRQALMEKASKAAMVMNSPAMDSAMRQVGEITALMTESEMTEDAAEKQSIIEKLDSMVYDAMENGGAEFIKLGDADGYKNVMSKAIQATLARSDQENQTMASTSQVYGYGRVDLSEPLYKNIDQYEVMPLPHTPANEAEAMIDDARWTGKMSKADLTVPQKVDNSVANRRLEGADMYLNLRMAENKGQVPKGISQQYLSEAEDLKAGITPMCLTNGITYQEYADCLYKKGWSAPYSQTMEFDEDKRKVTTLAATGRILGRTGGKEADYNEGTYAWALDVVDGIILNEVLKNEVYAKESGLSGVSMQMMNTSARIARQNLRDSGKFDEYVDTSHFSDNGFDPYNPNKKPECAADIKQSALYDFIDKRIVSLGGKEGSPQAEKIAEFMRGAIKDRGIQMKVKLNLKTEGKTINPANRGIGKVANAKTTKVTKSILKANEEE